MSLQFRPSILFFVLLVVAQTTKAEPETGKWVDFTLSHGRVILPIQVEGHEARAMINTGANVSTISSHFLARELPNLGSYGTRRIGGTFGYEKRALYRDLEVSVLEKNRHIDVFEIDMAAADMTLGRNFLEYYVIQIDYPNQRLRLFDRKELDLRKRRNVKSQVGGDGLLIASVNLNDQKDLWLTLNTSANYGLLVRRVTAEDLGWLDDFELRDSSNSGIVRTVDVSTLKLPKMKIGPHELRDIEVRVPADGQSMTAPNTIASTGSHQKGKKVKGLIGYQILKDFVLTIDFKKGRLHIGTPTEPYLEPN